MPQFFSLAGSTDADHTEPNCLKRKGGLLRGESATRRSKQPAYFVAELAHVVAMCDERLPYVALAVELTKRQVYHQGLQVEANATGLVLKLIQLPPPSVEIGQTLAWRALLKRLLSASVRVIGKNNVKSWLVEFVFYSTPIVSAHAKEQCLRRPIYFQYEMCQQTAKTVTNLLGDWWKIVHLYSLVYCDLTDLELTVRSFSYNKLILGYGPDKGALVQITWDCHFKLTFGAAHNSLNAHTLIGQQLEAHLNETRNLTQLIQLLNETYLPLVSLSKLPGLPQLGVHNVSHKVPVQTFTIMPQSCVLIRLTYQGMYCLEIKIRGGGLVSVRDGAYSRFDMCNILSVFFPTPGLKSFLSKYQDIENGGFRRRSQSEDDNPPSPMEVDGGGFLTHRVQSPGLRFHPPLTPPSNPHTPASPHPHNFGSPATSFNLASPTSINPSPSGLVPNSPLNPQLSSPGGFNEGSPFPAPSHSPAASNCSPIGMPRPSPARPSYLHSPQQGTRVLPQRSWAGAVPTLLTLEALETLCHPTVHPLNIPGPDMSPLERFLGCVYMRKQLQRYVHNENYLTNLPTNEPGVIHFKVNETLHCRVGLNAQYLQSLHVKITHANDKELYAHDELQTLERFFELRVAAPPYKPTNTFTFCSILNSPPNVLKDFVQIMRLDVGGPHLAQQQGMKWSVQWLLRIPPNAVPIVPTGTQGVMGIRNKILFFVSFRKKKFQ